MPGSNVGSARWTASTSSVSAENSASFVSASSRACSLVVISPDSTGPATNSQPRSVERGESWSVLETVTLIGGSPSLEVDTTVTTLAVSSIVSSRPSSVTWQPSPSTHANLTTPGSGFGSATSVPYRSAYQT